MRELLVFHTSPETPTEYQPELPFDLVAYPGRGLYGEFGMERAWRSLLDRRGWSTMVRG